MAIKVVLAYISDYITKPTLKTYVVFDTNVSVFEKNSDMLHGTVDRREMARRMLTQIVNSLTAMMALIVNMAMKFLHLEAPQLCLIQKIQIAPQ